MRHFLTAQRAALPVLAAVAGALVAAPALADVTVSPTTAVQTTGENFTFTVVNDGTKPIGTIKLDWPRDTPMAEVYPLSVDDWAPRIDMQKLTKPLTTIHGGTPVTETAASITWIAMPGRDLAVGKSTKVAIAAGPMPTLSTMQFTIKTTYADGQAGPTMPTQVTLTPGSDQTGTGHGHSGSGTTSAEEQLFKDTIAEGDRGPSVWSIGGWVVAGVVLLGALVYFLRGRHRAAEEDDEPDDEDTQQAEATDEPKEPVGATAANSKWSFKG